MEFKIIEGTSPAHIEAETTKALNDGYRIVSTHTLNHPNMEWVIRTIFLVKEQVPGCGVGKDEPIL